MKHVSLLAFASLFAAVSALAVPSINDVRLVDNEYDAILGGTLEVDLAGPGAEFVYCDLTQGDSTTRIYLQGSGVDWSCTLPPCPAGGVTISITAEDAAGNTSSYIDQPFMVAENTTDARGLTNQRYPNINSWATSGSNLDDDWYGANYSRNVAVPQSITLNAPTVADADPITNKGSVQNGTGLIRTSDKVVDGVGSLWFKAKTSELTSSDGELKIAKFTSTGSGRNKIWYIHPITEVTVPRATGVAEWHQFHILLQDSPANATEQAHYVIYNNSVGIAIDLCDIVLTPVIPDVRIYKDELDYAPGFPSIKDPIEFHIAVSNVFPAAPAANFAPVLYWRQNAEDDWTPTPMTNVTGRTHTGDGTYACILTPEGNGLSDGPFEYFYEVSFSGYTPTFPARKNKGPLLNNVVNYRFDWYRYPYLIHTNAWGLLMDANENINEGRSPALYPTFRETFEKTGQQAFYHYSTSRDVAPDTPATNGLWDVTRKFDIRNLDEGWPSAQNVYYPYQDNASAAQLAIGSIEIPATYEYNKFLAKDGVRRFRSMYTDLSAVTADFSTNVESHLARAYPMQHVGDYTWQAILHVTNAVDAYFSVTGAWHSVPGATAYEAGPFEWVQLDQDELRINPPMDGTENDGSHLRDYEMTGYERKRTIVEQITNVVWDVKTTTALWVGVVTNAVETNALGQALVPPTADDVAYWFRRFEFEEQEDGSVATNELLQALNFVLNVVDPDRPELSTVTTNWYADFQDVINGAGAWYVTNECAVGTSSSYTLVPGATSTREETYFEYVLDEDSLPPHETVRTRVQIDYDGFLMYRFCTTNGSWQIRRAAWQDFNDWQADNQWYSRSFGLYDMKEFTTDLEGRALTTFEESLNGVLLDQNPAMEDYCDASGTYLYEYIGKNAKIVKDRVLSDNAPDWTSQTRNTEVVLRGYPGLEGSLETTSERPSQGRGTLKMRVRSHSDDDRNITYVPGSAWSNYRVIARITDPSPDQVSDAEHSLSLIGYWQDPFNYWEARITQHSDLMADQKGRTRNWFEVRLYQWIEGECFEKFGEIRGNGYGGWNNYTASNARWPTWPGRNSTDNNGAKNESGYWGWSGNDNDYGLFTLDRKDGTKPIRWVFVLDLLTDGTSVTPMVWAFRSHDIENNKCTACTLANAVNNNAFGNAPYFLYKFGPIDCSSSGATTSGRPGFNMRDCGLRIAPYVLPVAASVNFKGAGGSDAMNAVATSSGGADKWDRSAGAAYDRKRKIDVWQVSPGSNQESAPTILTRPAPQVFYGVRTYRTSEEEFPEGQFTAPVPFYQNGVTRDWDDEWDSYNGHDGDGIKSVAQYRWKDVSFAMDLWDQTYLSIKALSKDANGTLSKGNLAVDSISCDDWRGVTVWDRDYTDPEISAVSSFQATYAAIAADGRTGRRYELNRSRANPGRKQALTTPQLVHGVGDILFTYEVADHPVKVSVQLGDWTGSEWSDLEGGTSVLEAGSSGTMYVACLTNISGRLRIVADDPTEESRAHGQLGTLYVDNVRATDYPNTGDTSWEVYNALVSTFPPDVAQRAIPPLDALHLRKLKFDGATAAASTFRSAVLNDGEASQTPHGNVFDEHAPFIQTPSIETGVGEVSFWYRASPDNTGPAHLKLMVAKAGSTPDAQWRELTTDDLYWDSEKYATAEEDLEYMRQKAALEALSEITTSDWTYFSVEFYQQDFRLLRVFGENDGDNRVMLDNVLITEPVRSSIDVGAIEFTPGAPLSTKPTDVTVRLVNPRMQPEDIRVFLEWYAGTGPIAEFGITNTTYEVLTNTTTQTEDLGNGYTLVHTVTTIKTNDFHNVDVTRFRASLQNPERDWGYERWRSVGAQPAIRGEIAFTNAPGQPYTFLSSSPIPTDEFEPDTVVQYCVRVEYTGRFASPVYSELQGRVKNGYWFTNPDWYYPIDLNEAFSTAERPVSHFYVFSCPNDTVFFNEFRPWMGKGNHQDKQFVELIGPKGADIRNWRVEHYGIANGALNVDWVYYTNVLGQALLPGRQAAFREAYNQTTNKGWGVYVLGCSSIADRDETLFPAAFEENGDAGDSHPFLNVPGALRLRRSMGAWADRIAWGRPNNLTDFTRAGFAWANNIGSFTRDEYIWWTFAREGDANTDSLVWNTTATGTTGGFNQSEEMFLPSLLDGSGEEKETALVAAPVITGLELAEDGENYRISFEVCVTNGIALDASAKYTWDVEETGELSEDADWISMSEMGRVAMPAITAPADGTAVSYSVEIPYDRTVRFFRIKATWK